MQIAPAVSYEAGGIMEPTAGIGHYQADKKNEIDLRIYRKGKECERKRDQLTLHDFAVTIIAAYNKQSIAAISWHHLSGRKVPPLSRSGKN